MGRVSSSVVWCGDRKIGIEIGIEKKEFPKKIDLICIYPKKAVTLQAFYA